MISKQINSTKYESNHANMIIGSNTNSDTLKITLPGVKNLFCFQKENGKELIKNGKNSIAERNANGTNLEPF